MRSRASLTLLVGLIAFVGCATRPLLGQASNGLAAIAGSRAFYSTQPVQQLREGSFCSPAPCTLSGAGLSPGKANTMLIRANPRNPAQLVATAADYSCVLILGIYTSNDGGASWNEDCIETFASSGDGALAYADGIAYVAAADPLDSWPIFLVSSSNNGESWSAPVVAVSPLLGGETNVPSLQVDNSPESPYSHSVYLSATQFDAEIVKSQVSVSHSTDGGNTWTTTTVDPIQIKPIVDQYSRLAVGSDGTVYVAWQRCAMTGPNINCADTKAQMLLSKSTDGGNTWSAPVTIATVHLVPDTCDCSFFGNLPLTNEPVANIPVIGIDTSQGPHAGYLYAVMYDWTGTQMKVEVATSKDGGDTWNKPVVVAPAAKHDEFFPSLSVSPSGKVGVSWLDRRNDPLNVSYQPFAAISTNGGASFTKSYAVTPVLSDPYLDGNGGTYMGDYTGNTWDTNNFFLVTWPDTRNQQFMQDYVGGFRLK